MGTGRGAGARTPSQEEETEPDAHGVDLQSREQARLSDESELLKAATAEPWFVRAPLYFGIGIIGIPSLIAVASVYWVATSVTHRLRVIEQYNLSELQILNGVDTDMDRRWDSVRAFLSDDLKAQYQTCISASKNDEQRHRCLSPDARADEYGLGSK